MNVKRVRSVGLALGLLGLSGCGGANLGGSVNYYYGNYVATYSASNNTFGTATSFIIDTSGNITGYLIANGASTTTATFTGTVANTSPPPANTSGNVVFAGSTTQYPFTGTFNSFGHGWIMTVSTASTTPAVTYNISLQPQ